MRGPVLTGVDRRPASRDAVELASQFCEQAGSGLIAAHVPQGKYPFTSFDQSYQRWLRAYIDALRTDIAPALKRVPPGRRRDLRAYFAATAAGGLKELATSEKSRLIVVGSSQRTPMGQVLIGSTSATLLLDASCPVVVAPQGYAKAPRERLHRVGVAVDGCRASDLALERARDVAADLRAELVALSVESGHGAVARRSDIEQLVLKGPTVAALSRASLDFDVLVVGCREVGGVAGHPTVKSVSRRLLHTAACPLLVVPESLRDRPVSGIGSREATPT